MIAPEQRQRLADEVRQVMDRYTRAFEQGDLDAVTGYVRFPLTYIAESEVRTLDRYPFDPARLKAKIGLDHARVGFDVISIDTDKAHVLVNGTRHRADGSVIEAIESIYVLTNGDDGWKIVAFSGHRTPAAGA